MQNTILSWIHENVWLVEVIEVLVIMIASWLVGKYLVQGIFNIIIKRLDPDQRWTKILKALVIPAKWLVYLLGFCLAVYTLSLPNKIMMIVGQVSATVVVVLSGVALYRLMPALFGAVNKVGNHLAVDIDDLVSPFMTRILQFIIVVIDFFLVFAIWGINVGALFTGVGLAGLAVSMAAQDQIRNFLGGVVIITEKPFTIGNKIQSPSVLGVVEDITFRSTHLRTPDGDLQVVPNATLSNEPIKNLSRVNIPHVTVQFTLAKDTTKNQLDTLFASILSFLHEDDHYLAKQREYQVRVVEMNKEGVLISVNGPLSPMGAKDTGKAKNDLNVAILNLIETQGLQLA